MTYIAKKVSNELPVSETVEFFELVTMKDADDNDVQVRVLRGTWRLPELESEKSRLQQQLADVEARITELKKVL